ncbi:MAG: helix-turn-helix transcriptional regulator [Oscillospiraceae bacterium]|nr:helix-turn-helix transcriptional regulator [Oscillospiraceae bacterium]
MIGPRIAALRREAGLSQAELAQRLKVSPSAMGMYEQGRREPGAETLVAIARELGVSTDFLLTGDPRNAVETDALSAMLLSRITTADRRLENRPERPFSRAELAVLMAALLLEP